MALAQLLQITVDLDGRWDLDDGNPVRIERGNLHATTPGSATDLVGLVSVRQHLRQMMMRILLLVLP